MITKSLSLWFFFQNFFFVVIFTTMKISAMKYSGNRKIDKRTSTMRKEEGAMLKYIDDIEEQLFGVKLNTAVDAIATKRARKTNFILTSTKTC